MRHSDHTPGTMSLEETDLMTRLSRYHEWCEAYKVEILPEAQVAFRLRTSRLKLTQGRCSDLLPIMQILRHDSYIHTLDLSGVAIGDSGALVIADSIAGGAPLQTLNLSSCSIGEPGATALFKATMKNMHLHRLSMSNNKIGMGGCGALAYILKRTQYLYEIDVRFCALGSAGLREITRALLERAAAQEVRREAWIAKEHAAALGKKSPPSPQGSGGTHPYNHHHSHHHHQQQVHLGGWAWLLGGGLSKGDRLVITSAAQVKMLGARDVGDYPSRPSHPLPLTASSSSSSSSSGSNPKDHPPGLGAASSSIAGGVRPSSTAPSSPSRRDSTIDSDDVGDLCVLIGGNLVGLEVIASITHAVGLALTVVGAFYLLAKPRSPSGSLAALELLSYIVYLLCLGGWFSTALLRHSLFQLSSTIFEHLSPPAAFALIASTYTPFALINYGCVRGAWALLGVQWLVGVLGTIISSCSSSSSSSNTSTSTRGGSGGGDGGGMGRLLLLIYLLEGYSGSLLGLLLPQCLPTHAWYLLIASGVLFTCGVFFYSREKPLGGISRGISLWYGVIILACLLHFFAVFYYVAPPSGECFEAAERLGLAAGPHPSLQQQQGGDWGQAAGFGRATSGGGVDEQLYSSLLLNSGKPSDFFHLASELLQESSARVSSVSTAGKKVVVERLVVMLKDALRQLEQGGGGGIGGGGGGSDL